MKTNTIGFSGSIRPKINSTDAIGFGSGVE